MCVCVFHGSFRMGCNSESGAGCPQEEASGRPLSCLFSRRTSWFLRAPTSSPRGPQSSSHFRRKRHSSQGQPEGMEPALQITLSYSWRGVVVVVHYSALPPLSSKQLTWVFLLPALPHRHNHPVRWTLAPRSPNKQAEDLNPAQLALVVLLPLSGLMAPRR